MRGIGHILKCKKSNSIVQAIAKLENRRIEGSCDGRKGGIPDGN